MLRSPARSASRCGGTGSRRRHASAAPASASSSRSPARCRRSGGSKRPSQSTACAESASTESLGTSSDRCGAVPTGRGRFSPSATPPRTRWRGPTGRRASSASRSKTPGLSRRTTPLGFQPPAIGDEEIAAVAETLRSGWLTTGPKAAELERRAAEVLEAEHVLAVASGTAPVFADVRADDLNVDPARVAELVTERTKAILPVHLAGQPCDLEPLWKLGPPVIEDAAHAFESAYRGRKLGGLSDVTCFSLYATKNVAAGEGGLLATNRADVANAIGELRLMRRGDGSLYDITVPGYKTNLSDVLAAIALVQLDKLERHRAIRARQFAYYDEAVAELDGITALARDPRDTHALHLYIVRIDRERAGATRDDYQRALAEELISTSIHFLPVHRLTWYRERFRADCPVAERAGSEVLSLPLSPAHSDGDIRDAIDALQRVHARFAA